MTGKNFTVWKSQKSEENCRFLTFFNAYIDAHINKDWSYFIGFFKNLTVVNTYVLVSMFITYKFYEKTAIKLKAFI